MNMSGTATATRRRATRACDQCRKTKSRCDNPGHANQSCRNCLASAAECTYLQPCHKRGPPKGYLTALEQRLHDAEGLLGAIISSDDSRAMTLVSDLSKDPLAKSIIAEVAHSNFGPIGRSTVSDVASPRRHSRDLREQPVNEQDAPFLDSNGHLVFTVPSNTWQDYLNLRLSLEAKSRSQTSSQPSPETSSGQPPPPPLLSNDALPSPPIPDDTIPSSEADSTLMKIDPYVSPVSSWKTAVGRDSCDISEGEATTSLSSCSQSTLATVLNNRDEYIKHFIEASYNNLMQSFGVGCGSPDFLGLSPCMTRSPVDASVSLALGTIQSQWINPRGRCPSSPAAKPPVEHDP